MSGIRLEDPDYAPRAIKTLCRNCWNANPEKRPKFDDIIDFIKHNFKIKARNDNNWDKYNNMYSVTYAKLQFHETNMKNQFETILQSFNESSSVDLDKKTKCMDTTISIDDSVDASVSPNTITNQDCSYQKVDPVRSRALIACQMELELESFLASPANLKGKNVYTSHRSQISFIIQVIEHENHYQFGK